jgi:hypothetical protein
MLSDQQRAAFDRDGFVRLERALDDAEATRMADQIWALLATRYDIQRDDPASWRAGRVTGFQSLTRAGTFASLQTGAIGEALDDLLGPECWRRTERLGAPLVTFPERGAEWGVPSDGWHLDFPVRGSLDSLPGIRVLAHVASLEPRAGATMLVAGSHTLVKRMLAGDRAGDGRSPTVRSERARSVAWLGDLWSAEDENDRVGRFMDEGAVVDEVSLRVVELTGSPGDVVLMHPWIFHAASINRGSMPRMMISHSVFRTGEPPVA